MNQSFIDSYRYLTQHSQQTIPEPMQGLWLLHGDESLMSQWIVDCLRPIWQQHQQTIKRIELVSSKTWQEVLMELDSLSLFDPASAIIVTGNHKPDKDCISALENFAKRIAEQGQNTNNEIQHHLVWITKQLDKKSFSAKWLAPFNHFGQVIDCNLKDERQRQAVLQQQAQGFGLQLTADAWQFLMTHTQNNLLNAYQTLWRLSYLLTDSSQQPLNSDIDIKSTEVVKQSKTAVQVDLEQLEQALNSESSYSIYDLSNAMLTGDKQKVVDIIHGLQTVNEPATLVLWVIAKDMRLIQQLQTGKTANAIGIWRNKERLYASAVNRLNTDDTKDWADLLFNCDRALKGLIKQPVWELLLQAALAVTGIRLFTKQKTST